MSLSIATQREADWFAHRTAVLATMHGKETVIAPLVQQELQVTLLVPPALNTDQFGTFTREIQRTGDQRTAARLKAEAAMQQMGQTLGLASEGTFGPHPAFPYIASNREIVLLIDREHDLEVVGQDFSTETNYAHKVVETWEAAIAFARTVGFPDHGMVVMPPTDIAESASITKGIVTEADLVQAVTRMLEKHGRAHLETDMRAMVNPTRMKAIARATQDLIRKLKQRCPQCGTPGFDITSRKPGLPCDLCHAPTDLTLAAIYQCQSCGYSQEVSYPDGLKTADPGHCQYCNP